MTEYAPTTFYVLSAHTPSLADWRPVAGPFLTEHAAALAIPDTGLDPDNLVVVTRQWLADYLDFELGPVGDAHIRALQRG